MARKKKPNGTLETNKSWHCVKIIGGTTLFCTRKDKLTLQSISLQDGNEVVLVDPKSCKKTITSGKRVHWKCKF